MHIIHGVQCTLYNVHCAMQCGIHVVYLILHVLYYNSIIHFHIIYIYIYIYINLRAVTNGLLMYRNYCSFKVRGCHVCQKLLDVYSP